MRHHAEDGNQYHGLERLQEWEALRFGMFIHFGINTFTGRPFDGFRPPAETYAPSRLDVTQWLDVACEIGAGYAVLVTKHNPGFCLWPSRLTDYTVAASLTNTTDVVGAFVDACRDRGIRPGLYYNWYDMYKLPEDETECPGRDVDTARVVKAITYSDRYWEYATGQVRELLSMYGPVEMMWFDRGSTPGPERVREVYKLCHELQPDVLVLNNQANREGLYSGCWPLDVMNRENGPPPAAGHDPWMTIEDSRHYVPMEVCYRATTRWVHTMDNEPLPVDELVKIWRNSVGRGANLLLNLPPDRSGRIPERFVAPVREMKKRVND